MRLVYVSPGPIEAKAAEGLAEFATTWPGEVIALVAQEPTASVPVAPSVRVMAQTWSDPTVVRALDPDVLLALHRPEFASLSALAPTVFTAEFSRQIRVEQQSVGARGALDRARISMGQRRRDRTYRAMAHTSAGLQCNGHAAWDSYAAKSPDPLFFRDHRIRRADLTAAAARSTWHGDRAPRVAFSGRMTAVKGPGTVLEVARLLPEIEFVMVGDGDLRADLQRDAPVNVRFEGFLDFSTWKAFFREQVDLALLPYPQGDPAGTYYEALGCGVPVLGVFNATWPRLAAEGLGFVERDAATLARRIRSLQPHDLDVVRTHALASFEPFEDVAARRVAHLLRVARQANAD
ncbi:glycosyltransferase [uncultured Microbacterium sp.]|uniref:glycosyltransferase n=1 Tax=uncultured Microbacterium sp. TaxID=191216 RepID=UPI00263574B3|nr:glycosyltransferase [uncultured Microbacterium sp.]